MEVVRLIFCLLAMFLQKSVEAEVEENDDGLINLCDIRAGYWNYNTTSRQGPEYWDEQYVSCGGFFQSPIALPRNARFRDYGLFECRNCDRSYYDVTLRNDGYTVSLVFNAGDVPYIEGGDLPVRHYLHEVTFHWGSNDSMGFEHIIGNSTPKMGLEMHMLFKRIGRHMLGEAQLLMLAFLFEESSTENEQFKWLTAFLPDVTYKGTRTELKMGISLHKLTYPHRFDRTFYRYTGSLTTPPCTEGVIWHVYQDLYPVGPVQMELFRTILSSAEDENRTYMAPNIRPLQDLNNREIFKSRNDL